MAIVKMNKFTLLAFKSEKESILEKLQSFSDVQFINLQDDNILKKNAILKELYKDDGSKDYEACEEKLSMAKFALDFLKKSVPQKSKLHKMKIGKKEITLEDLEDKVINSSFEEIYEKLKEKEELLKTLENENNNLQSEVDYLMPFEQFDAKIEDVNAIKLPIYIGTIPKKYEDELISASDDFYLEIVSQDEKNLFLFIICEKNKKNELDKILIQLEFNEFKTNIKDKPINIIHKNLERIDKINAEIFFMQEALSSLEEECNMFELVCEYYEDIILRKNATNNFLQTDNVMVIQGWVPTEKNEKLSMLVKYVVGDDYFISFEDVAEEEIASVPVKLKNSKLNSSFESITKMFSIPRYDEIDPTPLLTPFYLLFFGMMVSDIGYGLVVLIATLVVLKYFKPDEETRKFIKFFFYLSFTVIGFGAIYGSFFGIEIPIPGHINPIKEINTVLIASVIFGVIQIFVALGIKAYMLIRIGKKKDAFYDVGSWVITLVSVALVIGAKSIGLSSILKTFFIITMIIGMAIIVLTGGRKEKKIAARLGQGAYSLYGITSYVSDLVSYTRLMALGLAGGSLAGAMNLIIGMLPGVAAIIIGPVIFIFGHLFNIGLSLLGAYVHTCRLQYVEYFGKFYEGGGIEFTPFKSKEKYINLKKYN